MAAIELSGVTKRFGDVTALNGLDLAVEEGEVFGFLGPNGAGKSTTIDVVLDFVRPTAGRVRVLGRDPREESVAVRQRAGVLPDDFDTYDRLTGRQHVAFAVESKSCDDDPEALLKRVGLADAADRRAGGYSTGMTQRLALAMALAGDPSLLVLDEPSSGLDPNGAREMRDIIREERDRGATVFFSSHSLEQVEAVCDRVGILRAGELVAQDTIEGLRSAVAGGTVLTVTASGITDESVAAVESLDGVTSVLADGETLTVSCRDDAKLPVLEAVEESGATVTDFTTDEPSLEEVFAAYTTDEQATEPQEGEAA